MKLKINNFCKIGHANIIIDGITVIAGENDTGKSTVGKVLFSLFNSVSDIEDKIERERIMEILKSCRRALYNYPDKNTSRGLANRAVTSRSKNIQEEIFAQGQAGGDLDIDTDTIRQIISEMLSDYAPLREIEEDEKENLIRDMASKIDDIINLSEHTITLEILSLYFKEVFNNQINTLMGKKVNAELELSIKDKNIQMRFEDNNCVSFKKELSIMHKALYIDDPFILDRLDDYGKGTNTMDDYLQELLLNSPQEDIMDGVIGTVLAKEKLAEVYKALQNIIPGQIIQNQDEEFYLKDERFVKPVYINNLSTGLKSFVILKLLIERGIIEEKDVLILDEPEIHLHPQWQIAYAELIVLLQKNFDLSVIVTTHSPYFLDAINLFSIKYGVGNNVNYYLSQLNDNKVNMESVTGNIEDIYAKMASPIQILDTMRYELNHK